MTINEYANWGICKRQSSAKTIIEWTLRGVQRMKEYKGFYVDDELNIYNRRGQKK